MATIQELEAALQKADAAGNIDDAKAFASEIRRLKTPQQSAAAQIAGDHITKGAQAVSSATPAEVIAGNPATRFAMGAADPFIGAVQLQANVHPLGRFLGLNDRINEQVGNVDNIVQAGREANASGGIDWTRIAGGVFSPANKAISGAMGAPSLAKNVAGGMISGSSAPVVGGEMTADEFAKQKGIQTALGGAGGAVATALSRLVQPIVQSDAVKRLMGDGVIPTPGQAAGADSFLGRTEQSLMSLPVIGNIIRSARDRATNEFNLAAINQALPKTEKGTITQAGREAIEKADDILGSAYDKVYGSIKVSPDTSFSRAIGTIRNDPDYALSPELQSKFSQIVQQQVFGRMQNGELPGMLAQRADSQLGRLAKEYVSSSDADQRMLGVALRDAQAAFKQLVERNAGPDVAGTIRELNKSYAQFLRVERAASMQGAREGVFSGDQLSSAVRALDPSRNKGNFASGNAVMQEFSDAGKAVLGGTVNNSGTADRAAVMSALAALGGAGAAGANEYYGGPGYLTALALAPALYSRTGSKYAVGAFPGQNSLSQLLQSLGPNAGQAAADLQRESRR